MTEEDPIKLKTTMAYNEYSIYAGQNFIVIYCTLTSEHSTLFATSFGNDYDTLFKSKKKLMRKAALDNLGSIIPMARQALEHAVNQGLSKAALVRITDPDTSDLKWAIVSAVGNIDLKASDIDTVERLAKQAATVLRFLRDLTEHSTKNANKLFKLKSIVKNVCYYTPKSSGIIM